MSHYNAGYESNDCEESAQSDEKMDTSSESPLSADLEDDANIHRHIVESASDVLRLQNPNTEDLNKTSNVLRLNNPINDNERYRENFERYRDSRQVSEENDVERKSKLYSDSPVGCDGFLNDSLMNQMSKLKIESDASTETNSRPLRLGISPPKLSSTLQTTSDHPLMGLASPDATENYPDIVPEKKRIHRDEETKDSSLSSIEDDKYHGSFVDFSDVPQRNTSKNNLYVSDNLSIFETNDARSREVSTPDVARVQNGSYPPSKQYDGRRKIVPCFRETDHLTDRVKDHSPRRVLGRPVDYSTPTLAEKALVNYVEERNKRLEHGDGCGESADRPTVEVSEPLDIPVHEFDSGPAEWADSPSQLRAMANFQLPVELSSNNLADIEECGSPDALSTSTDDRSMYRALVDPASGSVALKHTPGGPGNTSRRRIVVVAPEEDRLSVDSACSLQSDEAEPPPVGLAADAPAPDRPTNGEPERADDDDSSDDSPRNTQSDYSEPIPEYSYAEEQEEARCYRKIVLPTGGHLMCDMKVIEPYMRVLSHGGYAPYGAHIIVFSACHLPDSARKDYSYVVDNLFLYILWTLDRLVTDEYELVYLHGSASKHRMPNFHWLKKSYQLIDRRLRKSLKHLYLVHPTFWLKSIVFMTRPFISSKFSRKLSYVHSLAELFERVKVEPAAIPQQVRDYDAGRRR